MVDSVSVRGHDTIRWVTPGSASYNALADTAVFCASIGAIIDTLSVAWSSVEMDLPVVLAGARVDTFDGAVLGIATGNIEAGGWFRDG